MNLKLPKAILAITNENVQLLSGGAANEWNQCYRSMVKPQDRFRRVKRAISRWPSPNLSTSFRLILLCYGLKREPKRERRPRWRGQPSHIIHTMG